MEELEQKQVKEVVTETEEVEKVDSEIVEPIAHVSTTNEQNVRNLRAQKEEAERALRESYLFIERLQKESAASKKEIVEEPIIDDDDWVDGKNFSKVKKDLENVKRELAHTQQVTTRTRLNSEFPDIKQVLSPKNIERLEKEHPEFSPGIIATTNKYDQFKMMYKLVKNLGIYSNIQKQVVNPNSKKPLPVAAISRDDSALTHAHGFKITEEEKAEFRRRNKEAMR